MKNLLIRLISGIIIVLLTFYIVFKGGKLIFYFNLVLSINGINELYTATENIGIKPLKGIGYISCILLPLYALDSELVLSLFVYIFIIIILMSVFYLVKGRTLSDILITLFGIFYIPFLLQHIIYLGGSKLIWLVFIIAWGTDTFAYLTGITIGKTKLCPRLSPKKTVEGSIGGMIGSLLLTIIFIHYFKIPAIWKFVILSLLGSIIAQLGDLIASKIKRTTGIKDYGVIMPGHGGVLDRFDSVLFTAPFVYYFSNLFL